MAMIRRPLWAAFVVVAMVPVCAKAQGMEWDKLPDPKHLSRVLDTGTFLGKNSKGAPQSGARYVQVGAFKRRESAMAQVDRVKETGLIAVLGREAGLHLVLMPETERNSAETLAGWARRSGYSDAYIRTIK